MIQDAFSAFFVQSAPFYRTLRECLRSRKVVSATVRGVMKTLIDPVTRGLRAVDLQILEPFVRLLAWDDPEEQFRKIFRQVLIPVAAFALFLVAWSAVAKRVVTKYGTLPTPAQVWEQAGVLVSEHFEVRGRRLAFEAANAARADKLTQAAGVLRTQAQAVTGAATTRLMEDVQSLERQAGALRLQRFSSNPTYLEQIGTSLKTVFTGFLLASLIAVPLGILGGLSPTFASAINPFVQIFKPVSPLAWLPIVMIVVGALYTADPATAWFEKSFISSAVTVALCSLWPTLMNTTLGVAAVEKDHLNVAQVLGLDWSTRIRKIVIPSALPMIFAGLRISLGVGWMVLIAAEMLAQNPGLGKFVWDMFQNGSSQTLAQIMVAVFTVGLIGFVLDRVMVLLQRSVSFDRQGA